ncbi:FAD/FMN-dependent dehydrogenase [Metarhizium anisopliae]|nr:FAD/FMN-dependent dehydrogenase [Metarhizium anisopliae]
MLNLSAMTGRRVDNNTLLLEPGCLLAGSIDMLAKNQKAVPHGDCFGVGAGGHFLTAGWDLILARHFGLGCQSVVGGRVVLWDGTVLEVDGNHAELLYAMRGGAAAGVDHLKKNPTRLADVTQEDLHNNPLDYWTESSTKREMDTSYFTLISYWVRTNCEDMFNDLYHAFEEVPSRHPARERMYALAILGGGRTNELQDQCAMPLGEALARFELHWDDDAKERRWSERFTAKISEILRSVEDPSPGRPYRGDVWIEGQDRDATLDAIFKIYDRRFV